MIVPPFESETKKTSNAITKPKLQNTPIIESGTSVAPRQRPKGSSAHAQHPLPIGLPPSPSPRNTIASPQPVIEQFQANFPAIPAPQQQTQSQPQSSQQTPQLQLQQQQQQQAQIPTPQTPQQAVAIASNNINNITLSTNSNSSTTNLDSLFESKYPDPFRETSEKNLENKSFSLISGGATTTTTIITATTTTTITQTKEPLSLPQDIVMPLTTPTNLGTPTKQTILTGPKVGHRRNMSDTSAFNKTFANETSQFLAPYDQSVKGNLDLVQQNQQNQIENNNASASSLIAGGDNNLQSGFFFIDHQNMPNNRLQQQSLQQQQHQAQTLSSSISNTELSSLPSMNINQGQGSLERGIDKWNPFEEQPFSQMSVTQ